MLPKRHSIAINARDNGFMADIISQVGEIDIASARLARHKYRRHVSHFHKPAIDFGAPKVLNF